MSRLQGDLPTWQEKKELLYNRELAIEPAEFVEIGVRLEQAGRLNDALEFFSRACDDSGMSRIEDRAVQEGNFFLYARCRDLGKKAVEPESIRNLARAAVEAGKFAYAYRAYLSIGEEAEAQSVREKLKSILPNSELLFEEDDS